jgi:hypothetical protein
MIDLSKLTRAPWHANMGWHHGGAVSTPCGRIELGEDREDDAAFIALARNAFDVLQRRGWSICREHLWGDPVRRNKLAWIVRWPNYLDGKLGEIVGPLGNELIWAADPFTALVEADKWYREQVEGRDA